MNLEIITISRNICIPTMDGITATMGDEYDAYIVTDIIPQIHPDGSPVFPIYSGCSVRWGSTIMPAARNGYRRVWRGVRSVILVKPACRINDIPE
jgi:hypothetical protein